MKHYDHVAITGADELAETALGSAGQMAIEFRRYDEARKHFEAALVKNPVGDARHAALWGLGWVAFRTGDFVQARRFFESLRMEAPYGPLAPRAWYWSARALVEQRDEAAAKELMSELVSTFPVDYYAYRAADWLGRPAYSDASYPAQPESEHPRVVSVDSFFSNGMPVRARRALKSVLASANSLGPHELLRLESVANELGDGRIAKRLRFERQRRYPLGSDARRALRGLYPRRFVRTLNKHAKRERVAASLLVAVARQESGFNPRAVSAVGAVGLLQLMPATGSSLLDEEDARLSSTETLMDPEVNSRLGARYLGRMLRAFRGREEYALAAYNAGPGAVTRWRQSRGDLPEDIFVEEIPYRETRDYVRRVLAASRVYGYATSDAPVDTLPASYGDALASHFVP
jgi:soluble lytic murein transglycosylase